MSLGAGRGKMKRRWRDWWRKVGNGVRFVHDRSLSTPELVAAMLVLSSALSHLLVRVLAIGTDAIDRGKIDNSPGEPVLMIGSSLTFFGVSFRQIAKVMERPLVTCGVGGCSPCELETFAREVPEATRLISGVSLFDLTENNLSDSRAGHAAASTIWSPRRLAKQLGCR